MITYGSVCSGIEAASVAWEPIGFAPLWFSEVDAFPSSVLRHHWSHVPNLGDMTRLPALMRAGMLPAPQVLVGGTPCQSFSVAGRRTGLSDERGSLTLAYVDLLDAIDEQRPDGDEAVCLWENVPGVLSDSGNAFGHFLAALAGDDRPMEPGPVPSPGKSSAFWSWRKADGLHVPKWPKSGAVIGPRRRVAWRVLDAQFFGVAQRRKRVFVVASARNGFDPCAVLFEPEGVRRDSPSSRETGQEAAGTLASRTGAGGFPRTDEALSGYVQPTASPVTPGDRRSDRGDGSDNLIPTAGCWWDGGQVSQTLDAVLHKGQTMPEKNRFPAVLQPVLAFDTTQVTGPHNYSNPKPGDPCHPLAAGAHPPAIAIQNATRGKAQNGLGVAHPGDPMYTLDNGSQHGVACVHGAQAPDARHDQAHTLGRNSGQENAVRRLLPVECERLQGFPDGHTDVPHNGKPAADGPRYKAIGNSKAVPVVRWIGRRINQELNA